MNEVQYLLERYFAKMSIMTKKNITKCNKVSRKIQHFTSSLLYSSFDFNDQHLFRLT